AALWLGENGQGFVRMVNTLHNLPYLPVIEITLLGVPIAIHMVWGIRYALKSKSNAHKTDGSSPSLSKYGRNKAYTWQRITSWILVFGIIGHVTKFRFLDYPQSVNQGNQSVYFVKLDKDENLIGLSRKLDVQLYDAAAVSQEVKNLKQKSRTISGKVSLDEAKESYQKQEIVVKALQKISLHSNEVIAKSTNFGTVTLLTVRETFKSPIYCVLYTIFVLAACFHAFNGLWTFLLSWGLVIRLAAQRSLLKFSIGLMGIIAFLGLAAIWGS
ncbi:MAG: succinate dehydrogenase, partial [Verrucomicrobia bacterium]|nr:succinate dehydrogenase [Verrucomicrobiota bacterium]